MAKQQVNFKAYPGLAPALAPVRRPVIGVCGECNKTTTIEMVLYAYHYDHAHSRIVGEPLRNLCAPCARELFGVDP